MERKSNISKVQTFLGGGKNKDNSVNSKKVWIVILSIQFIILLLYFCIAIIGQRGKIKVIDAPLSSWQSHDIQYDGSVWHIDDGQLPSEGDSVDLLYGPYINLPKGNYTVSISYQCDFDQSAHPFANNGKNVFIKGNSFILDKNLNSVSYDFRTTENLDNFELVVNYNRQGSFTVSGITITTNHNGLKQGFLWLLLLFLVSDGVLIFNILTEDSRKIVLGIIGITCAASLPLLYQGINSAVGHDLSFHLYRIEGMAKELKLGHFPVRMQSAWLSGYGYPVSNYYGDFLLYFPAILRVFGVPIVIAYKIFVLFINALTAIIAYFSFSHIFNNRKGLGLLLSLVYSTSIYRLSDLYVRAAVGEYNAVSFLPLVALAFWKIYTSKKPSKNQQIEYSLALAAGMAGIVCSHILSVEMSAFILVVLAIVLVRKTLRSSTLKVLMLSVIECILLSAAFLVPFIDSYVNDSVFINKIVNGDPKLIQENGSYVADFFTFFRWQPFGTGRGWMSAPGLILMSGLVISIYLWIMHRADLQMKILTVCACVTLWIATNLFPWDSFALHFKLGDLLAQVQFPWRYIAFSCLFLCLLLGKVLLVHERDGFLFTQDKESISRKSLCRRIYMCISGVALISSLFYLSGYVTFEGTSVANYRDTAELGSHNVVSAEYARYDKTSDTVSDVYNTPDSPIANLCNISDFIHNNGTISLSVDSASDGASVTLPEFNYIHYVAEDESGQIIKIDNGDNNTIKLAIPKGYSGHITVRYQIPWYWRVSELISLLSIVGLVLFEVRKNRRTGE